ncbi:MAG: putative b-glycosidase, glycoside hydrolase family 8 protein [Pseudomonadota bacterium]|jgi:endo-1,4-beta-D-glucanase Y
MHRIRAALAVPTSQHFASPLARRQQRRLRHTSAPLGLALGAALTVSTLSAGASAQALAGQFPFPSTNAEAGVTTGALTSHELRRLYQDFRTALIERCPQGDARLRYPESNNDTRSEGVGYGMVIAAYMGDRETFDGLWRYYQRTSSNGLMNWRRNGCDGGGGGGDNGSAADADIDAALAVLVADRQFPGNGYLQQGTELLGAIRGQLFQNGCQGVLLAGSQFAGCDCINPSYIPPGYYVAYGAVEQAGFWTQARDASYDYYRGVRNAQTGLVPAWSQDNGSLQLGCGPQVAGGGQTSEYQADAARTPWRVAIDYQWTGDARAADFLRSIGGFASSQQLMRMRDRYTLAGQPANGNELSSHELGRNTYVMGGFATAMVAGSQQQIDDFTGAWMSVYKSGDNFGGTFRAFNNSLALLYGLLVTGSMWSPFGDDPTPLPEAALQDAGAGNIVVNGDFDEGVFGWEAGSDYYDYGGSMTFTSSDGFALHQAGEMRLRVLRNEPSAPQRLSFRQQVSLQAGQRYRLSVDARATATRPLRLVVQGEDTTYGSIRVGAADTFTVDSQMRNYRTVFEATASDPEAELLFQFGQSSEDVTIDNVRLEPTQDPVDPGSTVGGGAAPAPAGTPSANGGLGTVQDPGRDASGAPVGNAPSVPTGSLATPSAQSCAPAGFSSELSLCYDTTTGFVRDPSTGQWTPPPPVQWCGEDEASPGTYNRWWPLLPGCYSPLSGYGFSEREARWVFVGTNYTRGSGLSSADDAAGCAVSGAGTGAGTERSSDARLGLVGLVGLAAAWRRRKR